MTENKNDKIDEDVIKGEQSKKEINEDLFSFLHLKNKYVLPLGIIILIIGFLGIFLVGAIYEHAGEKIKKYDTYAPAKVVKTKYFTKKDTSHDADPGDHFHCVTVYYEYEIEGKKYQSTRYSVFENYRSYDHSKYAIKFQKKWPAGKEFSVYVNSKNHSDAIISDDHEFPYLYSLMVFLVIVIGLNAIIVGYNLKKKKLHTNIKARLPIIILDAFAALIFIVFAILDSFYNII
jgi:Protein of unknown function (DUF3592)